MGGLVVAAYGFHEPWRSWRLRRRGEITLAEYVRSVERSDDDGDPEHRPVIAYTPRGGERIEVETLTGRPSAHQVPHDFVGGIALVRYDRTHPKNAYVVGYPEPSKGGPGLLVAVPAALFDIGAWIGLLG